MTEEIRYTPRTIKIHPDESTLPEDWEEWPCAYCGGLGPIPSWSIGDSGLPAEPICFKHFS